MIQISAREKDAAFTPILDPFSTSQTKNANLGAKKFIRCAYGAPFFAYQIQLATYGVTQGCCNHWDCPRCGEMRARQEYGRIVTGARLISMYNLLWFITITSRGKELSLQEDEEKYLEWTNVFFTSFRAQSKRHGQEWAYAQVTERQRRGHAHSHILTTACPLDIYEQIVPPKDRKKAYRNKDGSYSRLRSDWLQRAVISAGLGEQYDISLVASHEAASRYVAKYLFKQTALSYRWPKGWKRVRYSQSWPKMPDVSSDCMVLLSEDDWRWLGRRAAIVNVGDAEILADVRYHLAKSDAIVRLK